MEQKDINDAVADGGVHFSAVFEMVGKPKEHVEKTFAEYIEAIKKDSQFTIISEETAEATEVEESDSLFSTFSEMEVIAKNFAQVYDFCFKYLPASLEVIDPETVNLSSTDATGLINDFIGKMHERDMETKKANQTIRLLTQNVNIVLENLILAILKLRPCSVPEIAKGAGIIEDKVPPFLEKLEKEGKIKKTGEKYGLAK